jgi:hypothetical protein
MARAGKSSRHAGEKRAAAASAPPAEGAAGEASPVVYTIGHSTRSLEEFVGLLRAHGVRRLIDVRTVPRSRHNPQFNRDTLPADLERAGIGYRHMGGLGGLRKTRPDSVNRGWRNLSFRGYADYMQTEEFQAALSSLMKLADRSTVALMCAEAVPWRCHRSLVADALLVHGYEPFDIYSETRATRHKLPAWARARGERLTYPGESKRRAKKRPLKRSAARRSDDKTVKSR